MKLILAAIIGAALSCFAQAQNVVAASSKAGEMVSSLEAADDAKMTPAQKAQWDKLEKLICTDAVHINRNKDLAHQREHFMKLSNSVYSLVSSFKADEAEAFLHYCPMKKATLKKAGE